MQNPFRISRSYRVRHKILKVLFEDWEEDERDDRVMGSIKLSKKANIPIGDVHLWQGSLVEKGEITSSSNDGQIMMSIQLAGRNAYVQSKYIKEGRKEKWDSVWDWARIIIPLGALILSVINYFSNKNLEKRIDKIENSIKKNEPLK